MSKNMSASRQIHLDSLRGVAALIVVIVHYFAAFYPYTIFGLQGVYQQHSSLENLAFIPPFGIIISGHFAVCLFFVLSGYVLSYNYLGEPNQTHKILGSIAKRPIRLGGLVCFSIIVGFVFWYFGMFQNSPVSEISSSKPWFSNFWSGDSSFTNFLLDLTTSAFSKGSIYNPPLWTIKYELYGSIMVFFFLLLLGATKYRTLILIALVITFKDSLYQGFWIGVLIADMIKTYDLKNKIKSNSIYYYILIASFIYFSSYPHYVNQEFIKNTPYSLLPNDKGFGGGYPMLSAFVIFILAVTSNRFKEFLSCPALQYLGRISYGMYVIHLILIGSLSSWLFLNLNNHIGYHPSFLIVFFTGLPFVILMAHFATKYIDKPSIIFSNYIGNRAIAISELLSNMGRFRIKTLITKRCTRTK